MLIIIVILTVVKIFDPVIKNCFNFLDDMDNDCKFSALYTLTYTILDPFYVVCVVIITENISCVTIFSCKSIKK